MVARRQLVAAGATEGAIRHRLAAKRLHPVHPKVYAAGHPRLLPYARYMAAVLACDAGAVLSHRDAAALLGLLARVGPDRRHDPSTQHAAAPRHRRAPHPLSACPTKPPPASASPARTFARTLVDLAGCEPERRLRRALEQSLVLRLFDLRAMNGALERARGRAGTGIAAAAPRRGGRRAALHAQRAGTHLLGTGVHGGPPPARGQRLVLTHEVDFHWPQHKLIVEVDSRAFHAHALAFQRDRQRDLDLELAGWHVLRVAWRQVVEEPGRVTALLRSRLATRAPA